MPLHLIKLAVGVSDLDHLADVQRRRLAVHGDRPAIPLTTRRVPRRAPEILDGGSLYWVVRGTILVRQRVLGVETAVDAEGQGFCILQLDPELVPTVPAQRRPFQGWRYLEPDDAPGDRTGAGEGDALPDHLVSELRALGLM